MMESGDLRDDIKIPEGDIGTEIKTKFENGEDLLVSSFPMIPCFYIFIIVNSFPTHFHRKKAE